ncbi:hypothetical protein SO802_014633 [Lithocarpus litseifolius]|uniref:F-box domain-containing protein n=1 Tax=Lithocarpus litseifolius TaxID=425828 RepID=A0AAW2CS01_9ROSI
MADSAANQSESKCKRMKLSPDKDTAVGSTDRISNLPDSLLCHILYFLPTNEAIVTSILSSRWKPLWTLVPKIDLHDTSITGHSVSPLRIRYIVLAQHTTPILSNFTLSWHSPCDSSHFDKWIDTAISRSLQQLDLHIESKQLFELPHAVFHCKTLVSLELSGEIELDPPPSFQLSSLKILGLYEKCYTSHNSFSSLCSASACPSLEDLKVVRDDNYICIGFGSIYPSMFQNLVRLNFKVTRTNWHVLQSLLVVAPDLKVLVIDKDYYYKNQLCWMEPPDGPGCLSLHLTTFNFNGFEELEHEVEFIKYILKEARALNRVTIKVSDLHSKESVLKKLSIFPRQSSTCLLTVELGSIEGTRVFYVLQGR